MAPRKGSKPRPFTDEDLGYIADTMDLPAAPVAEHLGRSPQTIRTIRMKLRRGWSRTEPAPWSDLEDQMLREHTALTAEELVRLMPGRTAKAISARRNKIGLHAGNRMLRSPYAPANRTIVAKTCAGCGYLLPGKWFSKRSLSRVGWESQCRKCRARNADTDAVAPRKQDRTWEKKAQALTAATATRSGFEYMKADHEILSDPGMTVLSKALALHRTYHATNQAVHANGYESARWLGDAADDRWLIDNPNVARVDEIAAGLRSADAEKAPAARAPMWDSADELCGIA